MSDLALVKKDTVDVVAERVRSFQENGELHLPDNYSPENAMKAAWLILQETIDREKKPVLDTCTKDSIANALLGMIVQGLNPSKNQCYFIAYGKQLTLQRSYFGSMALAKRVDENIEDIYAEVVYQGDKFKFAKQRGKTVVTEHEQTLENMNKKDIIAAYACVLKKDGSEEATLMTFEEIKQAWKQSKMYPVNDKGEIKANTTHDKFTSDMCKKTVINRACKMIINSSDDSNLIIKYAKISDESRSEAEVEAEIYENANTESIDITPTEEENTHSELPPTVTGPDF